MADVHKIEDSPKNTIDSGASASSRRYSSDEVADIIRISLQNETNKSDNTIDHEELVAIAKDVGVNDLDVDKAIEQLEKEYKAKDKEKILWTKFKAHFIMFASITSLCVMTNLVTGTESFWSGYVLLGWGLFLIGHYAGLRYAPDFVQMTMERTMSLASGEEGLEDSETTVSFTIADPSGLIETEGMVSLEEDNLIVEYQTYDAVLGLLKGSVKEVVIPKSEINSALLEQKLFSALLIIKGKSLKMFKGIPGSSSGSIKLKVARPSQVAAASLVKALAN